MQKSEPQRKQQPSPPQVQTPVANRGFASADEPTWAPPEALPEPLPAEPILSETPQSPPQI